MQINSNHSTFNAILLRYDEIALKGGNRHQFEFLFIEGIKQALTAIPDLKFLQERGRILVHLPDFYSFSDQQMVKVETQLPLAFGLVSFSPGFMVPSTLEAIEARIDEVFPDQYSRITSTIGEKQPVSYRMRARRSNKSFAMTSNQLEIYFANKLIPNFPRLRVDLKQALLTIGVEVRKNWSFIFFETHSGPRGLPSGTNGTALGLLSGGIDSPVACYLAMKRGTRMNFLTFHSSPYTSPESIIKVAKLVRTLNRYQNRGKLFACNLAVAQRNIRDHCTERYRTILYRRLMTRIAERVATSTGAIALVTGESVGQVASQTLQNLNTINRSTSMLILRPLSSLDKQEVTEIARKIGTLPISEENCPDSCTVFSPKSPTTGVGVCRILKEEAKIDLEPLISSCLSSITLVDTQTYKEYPFPIKIGRN